MKNLEQIRARNALAAAKNPKLQITGQQGGEVIKKIPSMVMNHGFLATGAFGLGEKQKGWEDAFTAIAQHLADPDIALVPKDKTDAESLLTYLTSDDANSEKLKLVTNEAMAWLNYARRFINRDTNKEKDYK